MSELLQKQAKFSQMAARLILKAHEMGFEVTLGDAFRSEIDARMNAVIGNGKFPSFHTKRLAIDLNLFKDNFYLTETEDHRPLGEWWESQGGTWGGRWGDGNHYSLGE